LPTAGVKLAELILFAANIVFLNVQPIAGALLGALLLDEPLTGFTVAGGVAIVAGLAIAFGRAPR
jgi:drug/metabolite transporter (DMT)-like permease